MPRLFVVALAHLDTQWRWTARETVRRHLPATVAANERLFAAHPRYVLSFEGSWRYRLLAEYHPQLFELVRRRVREGRWYPAGAAVESFDALVPSPESILRQILYGRRWFARELGVESRDLFLPDCFGFPATLPTLASHAGIVGFSTQKLRRGPLLRAARPIPFPYGRWRGPDGSELLAALDPGEYSGRLASDPTADPSWIARFRALAEAGHAQLLLLYVGVGDRGGAVPEATVEQLERSLDERGEIELCHGGSDRIFVETTAADRARLPVAGGELLLRLHGTGCYTAKGAMKRWHRETLRLARAAESADAAASLGDGGSARGRLEIAWTHLLAHQMHDDLTGTSIPAAYRLSLADLGFAANEFAEILLDACSRVARRLGGEGERLLLFSPLAAPRNAIVEIEAPPGPPPTHAESPEGAAIPLQVVIAEDGSSRWLLPASFSGLEFAVHRLRREPVPPPTSGELEASVERLVSRRYAATFDSAGALVSLHDRRLGRDLLVSALELQLLPDRSPKYPAWEIRWQDAAAAPLARFDRLLERRVVERGPHRVALLVVRAAGDDVVRETWRLEAGDGGDLLTCEVELDWRSKGRLLKACLRSTARNPTASYDTGLGAIGRGIAEPSLYEVPAQHWAAIEDESGLFGGAMFCDARHGWDHPDAATLRSTWIHAPSPGTKHRHQATQDRGRHRFRYALGGFAGGAVARGELAHGADRFVHPVLSFAASGNGSGPRRWTVAQLAAPARMLALKPAEEPGTGVVARLSNPSLETVEARLDWWREPAARVAVDALERALSPAPAGAERRLAPSGLASERAAFAPHAPIAEPVDLDLPLPLDRRGSSRNGEAISGGFDGRGNCFPRELLPERLRDAAVPFLLRTSGPVAADVLAAAGQELALPPGYVELWLLGASIAGDRCALFGCGERALEIQVPDWRRPLLRESRWRRSWRGWRLDAGEFRRLPVAFVSGHLHDRRGRDRVLERGFLYALRLEVAGERSVRLPRDPALRLVAATLVSAPARPLAERWRTPLP